MNKRTDYGFTMVELLTVIAIIAILSAIIFPVMSSVQEKARQNACMTNLRQIGMAVSMFKSDNRYFPESLAPTLEDANNDSVADLAMEDVRNQPDCLYPEYVKSVQVYHCRNNDSKSTTAIMPGSKIGTVGLYAYDSYDAHPGLTNAVPQYTTEWAPNTGNMSPAMAVSATGLKTNDAADSKLRQGADYERQLKWRTPPGDTVLTWCMYHTNNPYDTAAMKGMAIVLYLDGHTDMITGTIIRDCMWRTRPKK